MNILFASDSFKGSLYSEQIAELLERAVGQVFPEARREGLLVADGGEGTVDALVKQLGGAIREIPVQGPLLEPVMARYGLLSESQAVIEMAAASGLPLVPADRRDPLKTTSYGTGLLIRDALDRGCREIAVALGGSATNDGGMGMLRALGIRFLDGNRQELQGCGEDLERVERIDCSGLHPAAAGTRFTVMCDVTNPLLGTAGAAYTFGPQKGADAPTLARLEAGMARYARIVENTVGIRAAELPGAGAAGGMGFAMTAFLNAQMRSGIDTVLDLIGFDEKLRDADLVITGEGQIDSQTACGKVVSGVGRRCSRAGVPVLAIAGGLLEGYQSIYDSGICSAVTTVRGVTTLEEALADAQALYLDAAVRLLRAVRCGMELRG